jgi:hypothetical protein
MMMIDIDHQLTEFISSQEMENSEMQQRVISLGKTLAKELKLDPGVDTLARWMAHYVAEKIVAAESIVGNEKAEIERQCFEIILKLWQHRSYYPGGIRPFENFDSILNTLDRLNPENKNSFYAFGLDDNFTRSKKRKKKDDVQEWLDVTLEIDKAARELISFTMNQAAQFASDDRTEKWLTNAIKLMDDRDLEIIFHILEKDASDDDKGEQEQLLEDQLDSLKSKVERLDYFKRISDNLRADLASKITELEETISMNNKTANKS